MQHRISTTQRKLRTISLCLAFAVAACGGGGGGDGGSIATPASDTPVPAPANPDGSAQPPAPAPTPGRPRRRSDTDTCAWAGTSSSPCSGLCTSSGSGYRHQHNSRHSARSQWVLSPGETPRAGRPQVSRLAGGGAVIAWVSGNSLVARQLDASGQPTGQQQSVAGLAQSDGGFAVAGLTGGDWVIAWADQPTPCNTARCTIQTRRFSATGALGKTRRSSFQTGMQPSTRTCKSRQCLTAAT